jgi:CBS domain-containing protein
MKVVDVMTKQVVSADPKMRIDEIAELMLKHGISAVPVTDSSGQIVGIVSEGDLMRRPETGTERSPCWWLRLFGNRDELAGLYVASHGLTAGDVMTRNVVTIDADAPLAEAAERMEGHRVKRLPVMRGDKLAGIISRANLVLALAMVGTFPGGDHDDTTIRQDIEEALEEEDWIRRSDIAVTVLNRVAHLWGRVDSLTQKQALEILAQRVSGVRSVRCHVSVKDVENARSVTLY